MENTEKKHWHEQKFEAIDYLKCRKALNQLGFTDKEIRAALIAANLDVDDITDKNGFEKFPHWLPVGEIITDRHSFQVKRYKGSYYKKEYTTGWLIRVPAHYQGLRHEKLLRALLEARFPWFESFTIIKKEEKKNDLFYKSIRSINDIPKEYDSMSVAELKQLLTSTESVDKVKSRWSLYEMHDEKYEIYLNTEFGTLYVPLKALLAGDVKAIKDRMTSYAMSYHDPKNLSGFSLNHRGRSREHYQADKWEDYNKMVAPIESKEAKELYKLIQQDK